MGYINFPLSLPFKMVLDQVTAGVHFDDGWAHEQYKYFDRKVRYFQKWVKSDTTKLQIESSFIPDPIKLRNAIGLTVKTFNWVSVLTYSAYSIYETTFDVSDIQPGIYFLYQETPDGNAISEPIDIRVSHPNTLSFVYSHSYNKNGVAWTTGVKFKFRCEAGIYGFVPERERSSFVNQTFDIKTIDATPMRSFKLLIGTAGGVAPYILDILNRIFCCTNIEIEGRDYETPSGAKWEVTTVKGYPLIGASIEIVPAQNKHVLQIGQGVPAGGFVAAYDMDTEFFGDGYPISITEIDRQW